MPIRRNEVEVRVGTLNNGKAPDWRYAMIVPLYKGKGKKTEYSNYRSITLLSAVGKIYAGILIERLQRVTGGLSDDEQGVYVN